MEKRKELQGGHAETRSIQISWIIKSKEDDGAKNADVAKSMKISVRLVQKLYSRYRKTGAVPVPGKPGRPRDDDRRIINGIIYVLISGCGWSEMPTKYGDDSTANRRLNSWQQKGVWRKILSRLIKTAHKQGKINLQKISIDSSTIAAKKGAA